MNWFQKIVFKVSCVFWKIVFWWKHRTGFLDLGREITVWGEIIRVDKNITGTFNDGDVCFDLKLPTELEWAITAFGRKTQADPSLPPSLHCEIPPWKREQFEPIFDKIQVGNVVEVSGQWGFDGVHVGKAEWIEVIYALFRHQPNVKDGWCEIHPLTKFALIQEKK